MKKKLFGLATSLVMAISTLGVMPTMAATIPETVDWEYELLDDRTAMIVDYKGSAEKIDIPSYINSIRVSALASGLFKANTTAKEITVSDGITSIDYAFDGCKSVETINLGKNADFTSSLDFDSTTLFKDCTSLKNINVDASNRKYASFDGSLFDKELTNVYVCPYAKTTLNLPETFKGFHWAFDYWGCQKLQNISVDAKNKDFSSYGGALYTKDQRSIILCPLNRTSIVLPKNLEHLYSNISIGYDDDFDLLYCDKLASINVDTANKYYSSKNGVLFNKNQTMLIMFPRANKSNTYTVPNTVKSIGDSAFTDCTNLKIITIPNSVKTIADYAIGYDSANNRIKDFRINCYPNSTALTYAKKNKINYKLLLPTVSNFKAAKTSKTKVKLTWNKVSGAKGYIVYQYNPSTKKWVRKAKPTANTYIVSNLKAGTTYKFAVKAYTKISGKEVTSPTYPTVVTSTLPANVKLTVQSGSKKATLKWGKTAGATGYLVYCKTSANGKWIKLANTKAFKLIKSDLKSKKYYWFTIRAYKTVAGKNYFGAFTTKKVKIN